MRLQGNGRGIVAAVTATVLLLAVLAGIWTLNRASTGVVGVEGPIDYASATSGPLASSVSPTPYDAALTSVATATSGATPGGPGSATVGPTPMPATPTAFESATLATTPPKPGTNRSTAVRSTGEPSRSGGRPEVIAAAGGIERLPKGNEYQKFYARYWETLREAYRKGDPRRLSEILEGPVLAEVERDVREQARHGRGTDLRIETLDLIFLDESAEGFAVQHSYVDESVYVDLRTGQPVEGHHGEEVHREPAAVTQTTFVRKLNGEWKVLVINRQGMQGVSR